MGVPNQKKKWLDVITKNVWKIMKKGQNFAKISIFSKICGQKVPKNENEAKSRQ